MTTLLTLQISPRLSGIIKAKRQQDNLGLRAAATLSGISASTLSRLERGVGAAPDVATMVNLSAWLNASVDDLLFGEESNFKELERLLTPDMIATHVRSNKNLSPEAAEALREVFRIAYILLTKRP